MSHLKKMDGWVEERGDCLDKVIGWKNEVNHLKKVDGWVAEKDGPPKQDGWVGGGNGGGRGAGC